MQELLLLIPMLAFALAQDTPVFRSDVSLVHIDAAVLRSDGEILTGLSKSDFRIFEDDREQEIVAFSADEQPLDLILLFDVSGSMQRSVQEVAAARQLALSELQKGDRVLVMSFNDRSHEVGSLSSDRRVIEDTLDMLARTRFGGGTRIQNAVDDAAAVFIGIHEPERRRRAILVVTDNIGRPARKQQAIIEHLWEADAIVNGLIARGPRFFRGGIDRMVEKTGGEMIRLDDAGDAFVELIHRIRSRYSLYYRLPQGTLRYRPRGNIRVELSAAASERFPGSHIVAPQRRVMPAAGNRR